MTCATCKHARKPDDRRMAGFVLCAPELAPWHYLAARRACQFDPPRWEVRK